MTMQVSKEKKNISTALYFSIVSSFLLITINIVRWHLIEIITVFLEPLVELSIGLVFLASLISGVVYCVRTIRNEKFAALMPITISIVTILIVCFVPFTDIMLARDFNSNLKDREKVVSIIKTGKLVPNISHNESLIALPKEYAHLSKGGGELVVKMEGDTLKVFFYTFRGVLDNFSGFAYISDDTALYQGDFNGDFHQIKKKKEHWYWGGSK
ncbi:hypothetical protein [Clostridium tagluense]|uniref:hypothetical protein n=1 Tax=Clostridium tagluense TaxID=360422 RepID=UPI001C0C6611|nr:hypothetical protein [Clostridium tagluense]MBU3128653.1 hypothetical protein [Clostridium tagluense]